MPRRKAPSQTRPDGSTRPVTRSQTRNGGSKELRESASGSASRRTSSKGSSSSSPSPPPKKVDWARLNPKTEHYEYVGTYPYGNNCYWFYFFSLSVWTIILLADLADLSVHWRWSSSCRRYCCYLHMAATRMDMTLFIDCTRLANELRTAKSRFQTFTMLFWAGTRPLFFSTLDL